MAGFQFVGVVFINKVAHSSKKRISYRIKAATISTTRFQILSDQIKLPIAQLLLMLIYKCTITSFIYLHIHILLYVERESTMNELPSCEVSLNKGVGIVGGGKEVALDGMEATLRRRFHENNIFLGKMIAKNFLGKIIGGKVGRA